MTRGPFALALVLPLFAGGCVESNPRWDGPDDAADGPVVDDDGGDDTGPLTSSDSGSGERGSEGSWGDADASSSGVPSCEDGQVVCDGLCTDSSKDALACGPACIDCTQRFGMRAECDAGECREGSSGPGDDD